MTTQFVSPMDVAVCSWWHEKSKKRLAELFNLTEEEIDALRATPEYKKCVFFLMLYRRSEEEFKEWVRTYPAKDMPEVFGKRMGLDPKIILAMVEAVQKVHEVIY